MTNTLLGMESLTFQGLERVKLERTPAGYPRFFFDGKKVSMASISKILGVLDKPALLPWGAGCAAQYAKDLLIELKKQGGELTDEFIERLFMESRVAYNKVSKEGKDLGTEAHELVGKVLLGESPKASEKAQQVLDSVRMWIAETGTKPVYANGKALLEVPLVHYKDNFICIADCVLEDKEGPFMGEFKTSKNKAYPEAGWQGAACLSAWNLLVPDFPLSRVKVLWFDKLEPQFQTYDVVNPELRYKGFLKIKSAYEENQLKDEFFIEGKRFGISL